MEVIQPDVVATKGKTKENLREEWDAFHCRSVYTKLNKIDIKNTVASNIA